MPGVTRTVTALLAAVTAAAAVYTDQFAVCVDGHGEPAVRQLADKHGFQLLHQVSSPGTDTALGRDMQREHE